MKKMVKKESSKYIAWLLYSFLLYAFLIFCSLFIVGECKLAWTGKSAEEAEAVAAIACSGHGRVYLDGLVHDDGKPCCECNSCYAGPDCSEFSTGCTADSYSGDPLFLEPFWQKHAADSALVVAGWHRMSYTYVEAEGISAELERQIRKLHETLRNAVTNERYIVFGAGSAQLLYAAVHALSPDNSSSPAKVVTSSPYYWLYEGQTEFFASVNSKFEGEAALWKNNEDDDTTMIEFVTSPNNPDGKMNKAILDGENVKIIYDHAYYWPHYAPISAPADEDLMVFTLSKLTGHAATRFGWALIKDVAVYQRMKKYIQINTIGVSRDIQLRVLKLLKVVLEGEGKEMFEFGYETMKDRWEKLSKILSSSKRFSYQLTTPQFCTFSRTVRQPSPAYAWLKCERAEDENCNQVLKSGNIKGRPGSEFSSDERYVRLSLIKRQDDFDLLMQRLSMLVSEEDGAKTM